MSKVGRCWVLLPMLIYAGLRLPAIVHSPGAQDEQYFSVPGYTVWLEGVPRIPYIPTRSRQSFFENADRCLMTLPPALSYCQAPFFAIFPPGYPTARIPSFLGAMIAILICFCVARRLSGSYLVSVITALLMAIGRPLMFTGQIARPDLLCAVCGWIAILMLYQFFLSRQFTWLLASGFACGLGALFHPFALVFGIQLSAGLVIANSGIKEKFKQMLILLIGCTMAVSMWVPLIVLFPDEFKSQFFANVLERAGPGLPSRFLSPWLSLSHHVELLFKYLGPWQSGLHLVALILGTLAIARSLPSRFAVGYVLLCWSSVYLTAIVAGFHPTQGYWVYASLWIMAGFAPFLQWLIPTKKSVNLEQGFIASFRRLGAGWSAILIAFLMSLPGAGLKTTYIYYTNWGDPKFHGGNFISKVLSDMPQDGLYLVDLSYVFDVYLSGRKTISAQDRTIYWPEQEIDYTAMLLAWQGEDAGIADQYNGVHEKRVGSREVDQECFVDIYRRSDEKPLLDTETVKKRNP